ncbi:Acetyl-/propionyl-coenzyme A carboxylase alpha chain, partial [Rhizoclosmatium hyalinum]
VPDLTGVRSDSGILTGSEITSYYDPLISKLTVHAETRAEAIRKMASVLRGVELFGLAAHNVGFLGNVIGSTEFQSGVYDTGIVGRLMKIESSPDMSKRLSHGLVAATVVGWHLRRVKTRDGPFRRIRSGFRNVPHKPQTYQLQDSKGTIYIVEYTVDDTAVSPVFEFKIRSKKEGKSGEVAEMHSGTVILTSATFDNTANSYINGTARIALDGVQRSISFSQSDTQIFVHSKDWEGYFQTFNINDVFKSKDSSGAGHDGVLISPMPCRIISVNSVTGSKVKPGDVILTIESMKMETKVRATVEGVVTVNVKEGDMLKAGEVVALIAPMK